MPRVHTSLLLIISALLIASAAAKLNHPTNATALRKRKPVKALKQPNAYVPHFDWEQQSYLNAHNVLRAKVGMPPLLWSPILATEAHNWAMKRRRDCNYRHHSPNIYGENIYWKSYREFTPEDVVQKWFDENKVYDHVNNVCLCSPERDGCECGHYLNVIWINTKYVGCSGAVYCSKQKGVLVVCQYDPAGLVQGVNPFTGTELKQIEFSKVDISLI